MHLQLSSAPSSVIRGCPLVDIRGTTGVTPGEPRWLLLFPSVSPGHHRYACCDLQLAAGMIRWNLPISGEFSVSRGNRGLRVSLPASPCDDGDRAFFRVLRFFLMTPSVPEMSDGPRYGTLLKRLLGSSDVSSAGPAQYGRRFSPASPSGPGVKCVVSLLWPPDDDSSEVPLPSDLRERCRRRSEATV